MIIPSGYGQVNFIYTGTAVPLGAEWTMGFENPNDQDVGTIAANMSVAYDDSDLESVIGIGADLTGILVKLGPNSTGPSVLLPTSIASDGGTPSDSPGTSTLVHKITALGGRAGRGRFYLPATPDAGVALGGGLTPTFIGQVNDRLGTFLTDLQGGDNPPVVLHGVGSPISTPTVITDLLVDAQIGTQRRRNRR